MSTELYRKDDCTITRYAGAKQPMVQITIDNKYATMTVKKLLQLCKHANEYP